MAAPSIPTVLAASWLVLVIAGFFWFRHRPANVPLAAVLAIAAGVRVVAALLAVDEGTYDLDSYHGVAHAILAGQDVYAPALLGRYPYLPGWDLWIAATYAAAGGSDYVFGLLYRVPIIAADVGIVWFLARQASPGLALLQATNPLSVMVSGYHGQFDSLPLLAAVLALTLGSPTGAGVSLGLGIWIKTWPALFLLVLYGRFRGRQRWLAVGTAVVVPVLVGALIGLWTHADPVALLIRVLGYHSGHDWGLPPLLVWLGLLPSWWMGIAAPSLIGTYLLVRRARGEIAAATSIVLATLAISPGGAIQYITWLCPLAVMSGEIVWLSRLVWVSLPYYFAGFFGALPNDPAGRLWNIPLTAWYMLSLPGWTVVTVWLLTGLYSAWRTRSVRQENAPELKFVNAAHAVALTSVESRKAQ